VGVHFYRPFYCETGPLVFADLYGRGTKALPLQRRSKRAKKKKKFITERVFSDYWGLSKLSGPAQMQEK